MSNKWVKLWERGEYNLHKMSQVAEGMFTAQTQRFLGQRWFGVMSIQMKNHNHAFCMLSQEFDDYYKRVVKIFFSQQKFRRYFRLYEDYKKFFVDISQKVGKAAPTADRKQLIKLMNIYSDIDFSYIIVGQWASFHLTEIGDAAMQKLAQAKGMSPMSTTKFLETVLAPYKMSAIRQERQELLKIALIKDVKKRASQLNKHTKKFEWIPCINVIVPKPWTKSFFEGELKKILKANNAKAELIKLEAGYKRTNYEFKKLLKQFSGKDKQSIERAHMMAFIKDDRDDIRRHAYYFATPLYQAIAKSLKISTNGILLYTGDEILSALHSGQLLSPSELKKRVQGYAVVVEKGKLAVKTGKDYQKYLKQVETKQKQSHTTKGISASGGVVRGKARIVQNVYELAKVKKGDILVTGTTHPDYLPAMRLAAAFVTDEGGLTSHAAIVAREMGKPCIVGTKDATKIFKDGDIIEVDANKGIVKKV